MSFTYYTPFVVAGGQVPSTQTNFPVLICVTDTRFKTVGNGGHVESSSGYDLRPCSNATLTSALTFELVPGTYSPTAGSFEMWVNVPSLADGYTIYLGYGNASIVTDGSSTSTWDTNYKGVWHFPDGSSLGLNDSTSNGGNGTGVSSPTAAAGQIDGGLNTDGTSFVTVPDQTYWDPAGDFTIELWMKYDTLPGNWWEHAFIAHDEGPGGTSNKWIFTRVADGSSIFKFHINHAFTGSVELNSSTTTTASGTWYHCGITRSGSTWTFYLNGATNGTASSALTIGDAAITLYFGNGEGGAGARFDGVQDEMRFTDGIARTTNWFTTAYNNQLAPSTFAPTGTEVPYTPPSGGTAAFHYYSQRSF